MSFLYSTFITLSAILLINGFLPPPPALALSSADADSSWHISALKVSYDNEKQLYIAEGEVTITGVKSKPHSKKKGVDSDQETIPKSDQKSNLKTDGEPDLKRGETTQLKADYVEFSNITRNAEASGNVLLISGKDSVVCDRLKLNLETETGTIYRGTVFIEANHFYIKGDTIEKSGKATYRADRASVTSCDGENPDWKLSGKDVNVTIDGYGTAKNATLWAGTIPALYSPIVLFPAKTERQTGLLTPRLSSSDRKGFEVEQPLFINISRGADATLYSDYMSERGMKMGLEYRYVLSSENYGTLFYDYLNDDKIDDGTTATTDFSYGSTPTRGNPDRYWLRMKNNHTFDNTWNTKLDIDYVSDADYLHEFKDGLTGFNSVSTYFRDNFGRNLDEYDDTTRKNSLNINRTWAGSTINMGAKWFDNVVARQIDSKDTTLQTLPSVELNTVRQQVGSSLLYYDLDSEYRYFYRNDTLDELVSGQRADIFPTVYMPLKFGAFYLEPSAGVRQTMWYVTSSDEDSPTDEEYSETEQFNHREMVDFNLELSTKLSKVFDTDNRFAEKIKHEILPTIEYSYTPDISQDKLPYFDDLDYIPEKNSLTWSLANRLTSRNKNGTNSDDKVKKSEARSHNHEQPFIYREFAWMEISQSYRMESTQPSELSETEELLQSEAYLQSASWLRSEYALRSERTFKAGKSFSDILAEVEFSPLPALSLNSDLKWSPYDNRVTSQDSGIILKDRRGDLLETWYRYEESESESESVFASLNTKLTDSINLFVACERSLTENKNIESHTGFYLKRPCWSMRVSYSDTPDDQSFSFIVSLHGIGDFGNR